MKYLHSLHSERDGGTLLVPEWSEGLAASIIEDDHTWELLGGTDESTIGRRDSSLFSQNNTDAPVTLPVQKNSFPAGKVASNSYESKARA